MANPSSETSRWRRPTFWIGLAIPVLLLLYIALLTATLPDNSEEEVGFTRFSEQLETGEIKSAKLLAQDNVVLFRTNDARQYRAVLPNNVNAVNAALERAIRGRVPLRVDKQSGKALLIPATFVVPSLMIACVFLLSFLHMRSGGRGAKAGKRKAKESPVTFADVAGNDEAVAEVREIRDYLKDPERLREIGAEPPRGILLVGPPGTGKTLLARAIAGEAGVPFFSASGTEFVEMFVGVGAARVWDLFQQVRKNAPAILFIDELDAAGRARAGTASVGNEERDQTLNQLLVEMDGFERFSGVVLIGATNRPDVLDPAILRRGRFDRQVVVDRPDRAGRLAILNLHAKGKRLDPSVRLDDLAARTPGFTGADLASVMNEAALLAARRAKRAITVDKFEEAVDRVLAGNERARVLSAEEKRAVAYHEAGHAIVAWALPGTDPVTKISIVSRGSTLGLTWMVAEEERFLVTKSELMARMAVAMGGMAAEELVFRESTSGPRSDLRKATVIARQMVCELGMSESLGRLALGQLVGAPYLSGDLYQVDYSDQVAAEIDREIRRFTNEAFGLATDVLKANRGLLDRVTTALETETVREPQLSALASAVVRPHGENGARTKDRLAIREGDSPDRLSSR